MVTHQQIIRITDSPLAGFKMLHLKDDRGVVVNAAWVAENRPEIGGYLIDNGKGEVWFAKNSLSNLPAVLVEVQRVAAQPGELILFKLPKDATQHDGATLAEFVRQFSSDLPFIIVQGELEVVAISASAAAALPKAQPCSQQLLTKGLPAPADCARCGLLGPCTEKLGEALP